MAGIDGITVVHSIQKWLPLTENWIFNQIKWQRRYRTAVVTQALSDNYPEIKGLHISESPAKLPRLFNKIYRKLTHRDVAKDLIIARYGNVLLHSHFGPVGWADSHLKNKIKHVTRFYGFDINKLPNKEPKWAERYKRLFDRCDAFLAEGNFMKKSLINKGCPKEKVYVHRLGIDSSRMPFKNRVLNGRLRILVAGRFTEKKGIVYAIQGLSKIYNDLGYKDLLITIVGDSFDDESEKYKNEMQLVIKESGMAHIVKMVGNKSYNELMDISLQHNLFLHPSITAKDGDCEGGYPVVLLDMMASGMPVISSLHCDIPEIIPDNRFGLLCKEKDSEGIANAVYSVITGKVAFNSEEIANYTRENFNWDESGKTLSRIYDRILGGEGTESTEGTEGTELR